MPEEIKPAAPQPGTPEYDAAMAAIGRETFNRSPDFKPENIPTGPAEKPPRPEHIPEKFWDAEKGEVRVEELAKSYSELEKGRGATKPAEVKIPEAKPGEPDNMAQAAAAAAGLDWDALGVKLAAGGLDAADYEALGKAGFPRAIVDDHITLLKESAQRQTELAIAHAGGDEKMGALLTWASKNLSEAEINEYNKQLGTRTGWKVALDTLMMKQAAASKTAGEPTLVPGGGRPDPATTTGYTSRAEQQKDMADPRYQTEPGFRQMVARKTAAMMGMAVG